MAEKIGRQMARAFALIVFFVLACAAPATPGQTRPSADAISASGSFDGQMYTNKLLGFTMLAPGGWNFFTRDQNKALVDANREKNASTQNPKYDRDLAAAAANTQVLFQATPPAVGKQANSALFSSGVERLLSAQTKEKYIETNKELVLRSPGVKLAKDVYTITFGGVGFIGFDVEGRTGGRAFRQRYIATIRKSTAIFFVVTLYDIKQDYIVGESLKTLKFSS